MFCSKCGAQVPEGSAFCTVCGNKIEPVNQQINEQGAQPSYEGPAVPQQPAYEPAQPQQPMYEQPAQPSYEGSAAPQQPAYEPAQPQQPMYEQPAQPSYDGPAAPQQPAYEPAQPQYQQAPPQFPQGGAPQPLPPKKSNKGLIIGIVAAVVVVVIVVAVLFGTGTIGGKDSGDSEDNKTTSSQQESGDSKDDSTTAPAQAVVANDKVTLNNGLSFGLGDKAEVFDNPKDLTVEILNEDSDSISLDDTLAAGKLCSITFDSETFDYSTIEVDIVVMNSTSSDMKVRDAEIVSVQVERESESRAEDETAIDVMGLKANATKEQVLAKLDELKYIQKDTLNVDEYDSDEFASVSSKNFSSLASGEYYVIYNGDYDFQCIVKSPNDNYIIFAIDDPDASEQYSVFQLFTEDFMKFQNENLR